MKTGEGRDGRSEKLRRLDDEALRQVTGGGNGSIAIPDNNSTGITATDGTIKKK